MSRRRGFTLIELLVVIAIIALLMSIMMPTLGRAKKLAKTILCMNNLKNWGLWFNFYTSENDHYFPEGLIATTTPEGLWYYSLRKYYKEDNPDMAMCPVATLKFGEGGRYGDPFSAWDFSVYNDPRWPPEYYGSYGINPWVYNQAPMKRPDDPPGPPAYWRHAKVQSPHEIPVLYGCTWHMLYPGPHEYDDPPGDEWETRGQGMSQVCINRHDGHINGVFMDFVPRKIGLRELWLLRWHRLWKVEEVFNDPPDWPDWLRRYKSYGY